MYDDDAQPIVTAIFIAIDMIVFMMMVSVMVMFFKDGYVITGTTRANMVSRDLVSATNTNTKKETLIDHEKLNNGYAVTKKNMYGTKQHYDGILTGEEVYNSIISATDYVEQGHTYTRSAYHKSYNEARKTDPDLSYHFGNAFFKNASLDDSNAVERNSNNGSLRYGDILTDLRIRDSQTSSYTQLGQNDKEHEGYSILKYAQEVDPNYLLYNNIVDIGTSDRPTYYKRTVGLYSYKDASGKLHATQDVAWVMYTKVS